MTRGAPAGSARAVAGYSIARLLVFLGVAGLLFLSGLRGALLVLAALLGSGLVSYVLLAPQRAAMAIALERALARRPRGFSARIAASAAAEDAYADALEERRRADLTPTDRSDQKN